MSFHEGTQIDGKDYQELDDRAKKLGMSIIKAKGSKVKLSGPPHVTLADVQREVSRADFYKTSKPYKTSAHYIQDVLETTVNPLDDTGRLSHFTIEFERPRTPPTLPVGEGGPSNYPHHRRTPFALSPDAKSAYLAYLDSSGVDVHVQKLDPTTFSAVGNATTVPGGHEAGGLVAMNDGFALLTNEVVPSTTANAPPGDTPVPVLYRYANGAQSWKTFLGGPNVHADDGLAMSPDLNGDLVYSEAAGLFGAYFVVTEYQGWAKGHFGDSVEYVNDKGELQNLKGASSSWGCSHNTGIAFEAADQPPYAGVCAEDHGAIWLNTDTQTMDGVKVSNENTTNGACNEARFIDSKSYIFSWVSRGATNLIEDTWRGQGYTSATNRTNNRNVAIALMSDKSTLVGPQAISEVGAADGDSQVNWVTNGTADCSNAHAAAFDSSNALVTWEEIEDPQCYFISMGCKGKFSGSKFQQVDGTGAKLGDPLVSMDTYVAGDMVTMPDGRICWPYPHVAWSLDQADNPWGGYGGQTADVPGNVTKMSFACMSLGNANDTGNGSASSVSIAAPSTTSQSSVAASSSAVSVESAGEPHSASVAATSAEVSATPTAPAYSGTSAAASAPAASSSATLSPYGLPPASPTAGSQSSQPAEVPGDASSAPNSIPSVPAGSSSLPDIYSSSSNAGPSAPGASTAASVSSESSCSCAASTVTVTATVTASPSLSKPDAAGAGSSVGAEPTDSSYEPTISGVITPGGPMIPAATPAAAESSTSACTKNAKRHADVHEYRAKFVI
ncbi:MAG: hypothetical protein Q9162_000984 [Coniocarpon cinnabarinum]